MTSRQSQAEETISDVLLRCLTGRLDPGECVFQLQRWSADFLLQRSHEEIFAVSSVILESILAFGTRYPTLKARALSSLLILSASSTRCWNTIANSRVFHLHPELGNLLACSIACSNSCFQYLPAEASEKISDAFVQLSDYDAYEKHGPLRQFPLTPVAIVLGEIRAARTDQEKRQMDFTDVYNSVLRRLPFEAFESIADDDLPRLLRQALRSDPDIKFLRIRTLVGLTRNTPASAEIIRVLGKFPTHSLSIQCLTPDSKKFSSLPVSSKEEDVPLSSDMKTAEEAYKLVKRLATEPSSDHNRSVHLVAKKWLAEKRYSLVAGAYVASPTLLHRLVENRKEVCNAVVDLHPLFWSPIDTSLDDNLADLLSTIPELARVLRRTSNNGQGAERSLKKIALIHPFIVVRRLDCVCAACRTVLNGITEQHVRYERPSLHILEVLFEVMLMLPKDSVQLCVVKDVCTDTLDFLLEENRIENGIPDLFSDLAVSVLKTLALCQEDNWDHHIQCLIEKVMTGTGTSFRIKETAQSLLMR